MPLIPGAPFRLPSMTLPSGRRVDGDVYRGAWCWWSEADVWCWDDRMGPTLSTAKGAQETRRAGSTWHGPPGRVRVQPCKGAGTSPCSANARRPSMRFAADSAGAKHVSARLTAPGDTAVAHGGAAWRFHRSCCADMGLGPRGPKRALSGLGSSTTPRSSTCTILPGRRLRAACPTTARV